MFGIQRCPVDDPLINHCFNPVLLELDVELDRCEPVAQKSLQEGVEVLLPLGVQLGDVYSINVDRGEVQVVLGVLVIQAVMGAHRDRLQGLRGADEELDRDDGFFHRRTALERVCDDLHLAAEDVVVEGDRAEAVGPIHLCVVNRVQGVGDRDLRNIIV